VLALPLEYLHDYLRLPRVYFPRAFPGGDADLEPDLDAPRPLVLTHIIADHPAINSHSQHIIPLISLPIPGLIPFRFRHSLSPPLSHALRGFFLARARVMVPVHPVTVGHPQGCGPGLAGQAGFA
jgi:hypothetical protein